MLGLEAGEPETLQDVAADTTATRTTELVSGMWEKTAESPIVAQPDDLLADWQPAELSPTAGSRRVVRWTAIIIAVLVGGAAAFALWWMPQASDQRAQAHAELMRQSLVDLYDDLTGLQESLAIATEPASGSPDLSSVSIALTGATDSAARLLDVSNDPVPEPLPLTSAEPFEELESIRPRLEPLAAEATSIRDEIGDIAGYRSALLEVIAVAEMPLTADSATITAQTASLARSLADSVAALNSMPGEGPFTEHRALVDEAITRFAQWQDDYLGALRSGDAAAAESLVVELAAARQGLQDALIPALAQLRSDLDARVLALADEITLILALIPE